jgi:gliding motility-associated peptidyl-prolyl isomerase
MKILSPVIIVFLMFFISGCEEEKPRRLQLSEKELTEKLIEHNKKKVLTEDEIIDEYVKEHYLNTQKTATGLRYVIVPAKIKSDKKPNKNDIVIIDYSISLINDQEIYSSKKEGGPELFRVEHEDAPAGLHEGLQLMHIGDSAIFIIPSHLAYGLTGDQGIIGENAILVYKVVLIEIE